MESTSTLDASLKEASSKNKIETNFTEFLKDEFIKKVKVNKSFSLRSYARFLDIHFATLSQLMSGKRAITEKTIKKIAPRLNATDENMQEWINALRNQVDDVEVARIFDEIDYKVLEKENLALLSEWYHDAIVELVNTKEFKKDVAWIARVFNISYIEADKAISRLFKLGLLGTDDEGNWIVTTNFKTTITSDLNTSKALRTYQSDLLQKSLESIEVIPIEERTHTSLMVAISKEQLANFREEIRVFRKKLNQMAAAGVESEGADSVYCFCISGFPVADL
jgi:uncharacterized protein (TIGR02147 family)